MNFAILQFPASNCDQDAIHAVRLLGHSARYVWHKENSLGATDVVIVPGGFSYGDYLRCGAIARFSPLMQSVIEFANAGGKVLGVCNGFQILCESHLLPGALLRNGNQQFVCKNVFIKGNSDDIYKIPVAHGEGRYYADEQTLNELEANGQVIFRYCDENGKINEAANPNGATRNIAGICNANRNVFGMMPHPERACSDVLGNSDGRQIIKDLLMAGQLVS